MYLSKRERRRFNYENYFRCNFYRGYKAASAKLFQLDPIELVKVSEVFAANVAAIELEYGRWCVPEDSEYTALIDAVEECCDEHTFIAVLTAGQAALISKSEPAWIRPEPDREKQMEKKRRGRKPQAYQDHYDEKSFWSWRGHRVSKCWKDQSHRKHQWR